VATNPYSFLSNPRREWYVKLLNNFQAPVGWPMRLKARSEFSDLDSVNGSFKSTTNTNWYYLNHKEI
jgi:hypothetical protein